jgi:hypothetical protein
MTLDGRTKYPSRRTYVVKVHIDAKPGTISGRLENLITGQQREFASGDELLDSITSDLEIIADEPMAGSNSPRPSS